jgi:hypothetical protein
MALKGYFANGDELAAELLRVPGIGLPRGLIRSNCSRGCGATKPARYSKTRFFRTLQDQALKQAIKRGSCVNAF